MTILETERLSLRELDSAIDAEFVFALLNTAKFIKYIGDRGVRSVEEAADFIEDRYRRSYREHGFGLYVVDSKVDIQTVGICGFVKRDNFEHADIGFAFLPAFERRGYGFESANAMLRYGRETLAFEHVLAITSQDNDVSVKLLEKLGFEFVRVETMPNDEALNLFSLKL